MNLLIEFLAGVAGYQFKKWFGDELMKYLIRPFFNHVLRPILRPVGRFLRARLVKTEADAIAFLHYKNKAAKQNHAKPVTVCDDDTCATI